MQIVIKPVDKVECAVIVPSHIPAFPYIYIISDDSIKK